MRTDGVAGTVGSHHLSEPGRTPHSQAGSGDGGALSLDVQRLAENAERYRSLFFNIEVGFCIIELVFDAAGRPCDYLFIEANPAFAQQAGFRPGVGQSMREIAPAHEQHWFDLYGRVALTGEPVFVDHEAMALERVFEVHAFRVGAPSQRRVGVLFTDVTGRRRAERQLRQLNSKLESEIAERIADRNRVWEMTSDLMGTAGYDGYLKAANPAWGRLIGCDEAALLSQPFVELIHPEDRANAESVIRRLKAGETVTNFIDRVRTVSGDYRTIMWQAVPDGERFHIVGRDLTEQREIEDRLRHSQKMEAVGQLTGGIAHDFNNMLTGILGSLELLRRHIADGRLDRVDRYITAATTSAQRAAGLTHRLLTFSRRQALDVRPVDVNELVTSMEELLRRTLGESSELAVLLHPAAWLARTDANQLESALLNLTINARDAMPIGGRLTIETLNVRLDSEDAAQRDGMTPGDYVVVSICDTGVGMTAEVLAKAYDPFFTTKPVGQGTGLGLSMVYGFVTQSGGHIAITSQPGVGTTVTLYLPRDFGFRPDAPTAKEVMKRAERGESILVVEDDPAVRLLVVDLLESLGYDVHEAPNGRDALVVIDTMPLDLLIVDVGLPGLDGRQIAEIARRNYPKLPILFMTGYAEQAASAADMLASGMDMITKPFAIDDLVSKISSMLVGAEKRG